MWDTMIPMSAADHHFRREDRTALWLRIARQIEQHSGDLAIVLENLDRWQALGHDLDLPVHHRHRFSIHRGAGDLAGQLNGQRNALRPPRVDGLAFEVDDRA